MFEPQKGEYANETSFLTGEDALSCASVAVLTNVPAEIALFTDGPFTLFLVHRLGEGSAMRRPPWAIEHSDPPPSMARR
jgi:hypothetical protein